MLKVCSHLVNHEPFDDSQRQKIEFLPDVLQVDNHVCRQGLLILQAEIPCQQGSGFECRTQSEGFVNV